MTIYTPPAPTVSGQTITVSYLVNNPVLVQRTLTALVQKRLIAGKLLTGRVDVTGSGSAVFEGSESIFAKEVAEIVDDLAEYPLTDDDPSTPSVYTVDKYGLATDIPDRLIARNRMDVVSRKLVKLANTVVAGFDARGLSVIGSAVTQTQAVTAAWNAAGADQLLDIMLGAAKVDALDEGFEVDTIVLKPVPWARLVASTKVLEHAAPAGGANALVTGKLFQYAGLSFLKSNRLPAGVEVMLADSAQLGSVLWEAQGGGYQGNPSDVDGVESKVIRLDKQDGVRVQVRKAQEPVVAEPGAAVKLTGV